MEENGEEKRGGLIVIAVTTRYKYSYTFVPGSGGLQVLNSLLYICAYAGPLCTSGEFTVSLKKALNYIAALSLFLVEFSGVA